MKGKGRNMNERPSSTLILAKTETVSVQTKQRLPFARGYLSPFPLLALGPQEKMGMSFPSHDPTELLMLFVALYVARCTWHIQN